MVERNLEEIAGFMKQRLEEKGVSVSKIIVFGSRAKGTAEEDSDTDLIIVSEDFRGKGLFERAKMIGDAEFQTVKQFKVSLDIILESPDEVNPALGTVVFAA